MKVAAKTVPAGNQLTSRTIKKAAVLGSGVMGSRIACHFANIGLEVILLDIPPRELNEKERAKGLKLEHPAVRNRIVNDSLKQAIKDKRAPLYKKESAHLIETGNFEDDFEKIKDCDWVLEAVVERLDIKRQVFEKVDQLRKPGSIISSNTSGIPIHLMVEGRSEDFRKHFLGTHFFNPPRYLRLLEIIPGPDTDPSLVDYMLHYGDLFLGKQTVLCKDTPGFIANRVGIYAIAKVFQIVKELGLTIEEVDKLSGKATGRPKTGIFRLSDLVGLDTTVHVLNGLKQNCPEDEQKELFEVPNYVQHMLEQRWLGEKTKQGFYKKVKSSEGKTEILALDINTLEYREQQKVSIPSLGKAKGLDHLADRLKMFFNADDKGGEFVRKSHLGLFAYVANRIPEIADHLYQIDEALKAGFGWDKGPFEMWDMLGIQYVIDQFEAENLIVAPWLKAMINTGYQQFYKTENGVRKFYQISSQSYEKVPGTESLILLNLIKDEKTIWSNNDASIIDLGDGVVNIEFHSKMNAIGDGVLKAIHHGIDMAEKNAYNGIVISNEGEVFSAGANLAFILMLAAEQEWEELNIAVKMFQNSTMRLRYSSIPVVVAPHSVTLGGACELVLHADKVVAAAETYIGLVEAGVGVIPAGSGTKEFALRASDQFKQEGVIPTNVLQPYLMNIATAKLAGSAFEAREMGILKQDDKIVVNASHRVKVAKETVLEMIEEGYTPKLPRKDIRVLGRNALSTFYAGISGMQYGYYASPHDVKIAKKVAFILCGGDLSGDDNVVSEQYLLDLEREAFLSLLGERKTQERIQHMLKTGKPLRN